MINEIKLAELARALEASGYRAVGSIDHVGPGGSVLQCMLDHKHFNVDLDLLRDLVKLAQGYEADIETTKSAAYDEGYEIGSADTYFECDCS